MQDIEKIKQYADEWAFDMKLNGIKSDGLINTDVIDQSIEMILATPLYSRLFNLSFGSNFSLRIFDNASPSTLKQVMRDTLDAIERWEDRILITRTDVSLDIQTDTNTIVLTIPYTIKNREISGTFSKSIRQ